MLAELAVADGYQVTALDRFGDVDLRAVAPGATAPTSDALAALASDIETDAVVYGAGFENRPDLVVQLSRDRELLGTPAELLAYVRDPWAVAAAARAAGARAPESRSADELPDTGRRGLCCASPCRGHWPARVGVRSATADGDPAAPDRRAVCSAVAIGDGRRAAVLGITEQLHRRPGFGWMGNVTPLVSPMRNSLSSTAGCTRSATRSPGRFEVRGAFGVDAVWNAARVGARVNPDRQARSGCSGLGASRRMSGARAGLRPPAPPGDGCANVKLVLFADRTVRAPDPGWWPAGVVRDIPCAGETIRRGSPVCTLMSAGVGVPELVERGSRLLSALHHGALVGG
jgi:hypothetical protein